MGLVAAAGSLLEGLDDLFTVNAMRLPKALSRCLCTTNIMESPHSGVQMRTRRVCHWQDGQMVRRWATAAFLETNQKSDNFSGVQILISSPHSVYPAVIQLPYQQEYL